MEVLDADADNDDDGAVPKDDLTLLEADGECSEAAWDRVLLEDDADGPAEVEELWDADEMFTPRACMNCCC
jgi:hypothetical protein